MLKYFVFQGIYFSGTAALLGDQSMSAPIGNLSSGTISYSNYVTVHFHSLLSYWSRNNLCVTDASIFEMEYSGWLEEHHRVMCELRNAVQEHLPENELRLFVDNCLAHYDQLMNLKSMIAKSDVFYLVSGIWKTPAERCAMWMGGFRPSELIKVYVHMSNTHTHTRKPYSRNYYRFNVINR